MLVLSPWTYWSYRLTGAGSVVSSTRIGYGLWIGNNPYTFSYYPNESIDRSRGVALEALSPQEKAELEELAPDGVAVDKWFRERALQYMREDLLRTLDSSFRKIEAAFGWLPSPRRDFFRNLVYSLSYGFVVTFGLWGMWVGRRHWRELLIFCALFFSFAAITALFWGHTSHRAYLDVYWIVFAAGALDRLRSSFFSVADK